MIIERATETGRSRQNFEVLSAVQYFPLQHALCQQFATGKHNLKCGNHSQYLMIHYSIYSPPICICYRQLLAHKFSVILRYYIKTSVT